MGDIVTGVVVACESFGALVEHDCVRYFVPRHELSWKKLVHSADVVSVGEYCEIMIDRLEHSSFGRPLASVRRVHPCQNPWYDPDVFAVGTRFTGHLAHIHSFGWLVTHPAGVDGLLHSDDIPVGLNAVVGDVLCVEIIDCDVENQQFRLAVVQG